MTPTPALVPLTVDIDQVSNGYIVHDRQGYPSGSTYAVARSWVARDAKELAALMIFLAKTSTPLQEKP